MLFRLLKAYARFALRIYCRRVIVNQPDLLKRTGPVLYAANHPNSFLDGIILTTLLDAPLYSLARGDVFRNPRARRWLHRLRLLPVYRPSEGPENLVHNYSTFEACKEVFADGKQVIIFSEGRCINEWHLRPLRKGTARLAIGTWEKGIDLTVVPLGFNYNAFRNFGKNVFLNFGPPLDRDRVLGEQGEGRQLLAFNAQLEAGLRELVYEIPKNDLAAQKAQLHVPVPFMKKVLLALPAALGWLLHAALYYGVKAFTLARFNNDHFDSVVATALMMAYPLYLVLVVTLGLLVAGWWGFALLALLPFTAWACVQVKKQGSEW
ncbi:MAG: 1-acyl-sn-glycerol-3-phosphate acyltransferase [Flaviaesturariibacter sp.]|nr:1-acyl-sn-glycerol-3-phosphate acyltransferase [Flaviaesturariibacter sp.]